MLKKIGFTLSAFILLFVVTVKSQNSDDVKINAAKVTDNIYMLQGQGGNIGLFFGKNGVFLIDDQFAPLHDKITAKIKELSGSLVPENSNMYVINTHFHGDHTGGNELMGKSGAVIIAHENVRIKLPVEQVNKFFNSTTPAMPPDGLPVITFTTDLTFHLNDDSVNIYHVPSAHTDGDAIVHFTKANVIHSGDIIFTNTYPFIDIDKGGSVAGTIAAAKRILSMCNAETKIIPGHGNLTDKAGLEKYIKMLSSILERVKQMAAAGKSLDEIKAAQPTAEFDADYNGFISNDGFLGIVYAAVTK